MSALKSRALLWSALVVVAIVGCTLSSPGRALRHRVFAELRIAKPQPVNVNIPSFAGPNAGRQLQDLVGGMVSTKVNVTLNEVDQPVASADAATRAAGFAPELPRARTDAATLIVVGARAVEMPVDRAQLHTIFLEAGKADLDKTVPQSVDGGTVAVTTPRGVRAQYGNCPVPVAPTIQAQVQGQPPPSPDNGNCVVLIQTPVASARLPAGLDVAPLVDIALQLAGMSPIQAQAFERTLDAPSALVLSIPRNSRSWDSVTVNGTRGLLFNTVGRRGPTWALIWSRNGIAYSLVGYGTSADAVPLASSLR